MLLVGQRISDAINAKTAAAIACFNAGAVDRGVLVIAMFRKSKVCIVAKNLLSKRLPGAGLFGDLSGALKVPVSS
jgi:hypothetical protein